jgi:RNA polymerase sigma factor (sigma-70 family)
MRVKERDAVPTADDGDIITRSCLEPEQFALLFDRHAAHIHRYAAQRIGREAADDLVAETFLTAFSKRQRHPDARPWLYGIATRLIGQHRREELRQYRVRKAAIPAPNLPGHAELVAADERARGLRIELIAALAALPPDDRDLLVLIAWEQLTYDEAARTLGIPIGTVRSRLSRARTRIRSTLAATASPETIREILSNE